MAKKTTGKTVNLIRRPRYIKPIFKMFDSVNSDQPNKFVNILIESNYIFISCCLHM